jgi:dihydrofolate reductase
LAETYFDDVLAAAAAEGIVATDTYLFGRKTYEHMASYWPKAPADDPFAKHLNSTPKYVASRTLERADWENSTLLSGDVVKRVAELKQPPGGNIAVLGSGDLVQSLLDRRLVDELFVVLHPLVLGSGKRLFKGGPDTMKLELVESRATTTGAVMLTYRPL